MARPVKVGELDIGGPDLVVMAGPCSVESRDHILEMASLVKEAGADILRGGAFKPRTRAGEFDGLKEEGLKHLADARERYGLPFVTEIMSEAQIPMFQEYQVDIYQVGTRNAQNFDLLHALGELDVPVLLKRGMGNTVKEWLAASSHVTSRGNKRMILCERGISTIDPEFRNIADIAAVAYARKKSGFPVAFDPSHATGSREFVYPTSLASIMAGADTLLIEVHDDPDYALTDGPQSILPRELKILVRHARDLRRHYNETQEDYLSGMKNVTSGRLTIYFPESELGNVLGLVGMKESDFRPYGDGTGILYGRIESGCLDKLNRSYAIGKMTAFSSPGRNVPIVSVKQRGSPKTIITPYSAEAVKKGGGKTIVETYQGVRRVEFANRYPGDTIRDAFVTYEGLGPLIIRT